MLLMLLSHKIKEKRLWRMSWKRTLDRAAIIEKLFIVDALLLEVLSIGERVKLIVFGSSAFSLKGLITRHTADIDTYTIRIV